MAYADPSLRVTPSARWYSVVAAAWVASAVCMFFAFKPLVDILTVTPTPVSNNTTIEVPGDGLTVYTSRSDLAVRCDLSDMSGERHAMEPISESGSIAVDGIDGTTMYPIAITPDGLPAGRYGLRCAGGSQGSLGVGDRVDFDSVALRLGLLIVVSGGLGLGGLIVLIVLLVKRHNSKSRIRWTQAAYAGWGQWYSYPYGSSPGGNQGGAGQPPAYPGAYHQPGQPVAGSPQVGWPYGYPAAESPASPAGELDDSAPAPDQGGPADDGSQRDDRG